MTHLISFLKHNSINNAYYLKHIINIPKYTEKQNLRNSERKNTRLPEKEIRMITFSLKIKEKAYLFKEKL